MAVEQLLQHVHPNAVYRRVPLPDDQNALGPWREAIQHYVPPADDDPLWGELVYGAGVEGTPVAFPSGSEGDRLRALLDRNQRALELVDEGIRRGRLQFSVELDDNARKLNADFTSGIRGLGHMLGVKGKSLHADGDDVGVCRLRVQLLRIGEMICNGDVWGADYIFGNGYRKWSLIRMQEAASRGEIPQSVLGELLSALERSAASPDGLAQSMRVELCCMDLPKIDQLPESGELECLVDQLLQLFYGRMLLDFKESMENAFKTPSDDRLAWRREQILSLLRGHPCPFDKMATVRLLGNRVASQIESLKFLVPQSRFRVVRAWRYSMFRVSWRRRWHQPRAMRYWPEQLTPSFPVEWLGRGEEARTALAEVQENSDAANYASWQPPSDDDVALACRKLHNVHNPVGLMLARSLLSFDLRRFATEYRTALEETKKLLTEQLKSRS